MSACSLLGVAARISVVGALTLAVTPEPGGAASDCTAAFVGDYAVRHMEMGGGIALRRDGSFRYELSYGALDEEAEGRWTCDKTTVFLTSNPVHPPRFAMLAADKAAKGELRIELDVPQGMSRQYFSVLIRKADGSTERREFGEDGIVVAYATQARPLAIVPLLPVYDLAGDGNRLVKSQKPDPLHTLFDKISILLFAGLQSQLSIFLFSNIIEHRHNRRLALILDQFIKSKSDTFFARLSSDSIGRIMKRSVFL